MQTVQHLGILSQLFNAHGFWNVVQVLWHYIVECHIQLEWQIDHWKASTDQHTEAFQLMFIVAFWDIIIAGITSVATSIVCFIAGKRKLGWFFLVTGGLLLGFILVKLSHLLGDSKGK
jgi:hypothetical protein